MPNTAVLAAGGALPTAQPTIFLAVTPTMRLRLATTIENLIALLAEYQAAQADLAKAKADLDWLVDEWRHLWPLAPEELLGGVWFDREVPHSRNPTVERDIAGRFLRRDTAPLTKRVERRSRAEHPTGIFDVTTAAYARDTLDRWRKSTFRGRNPKSLAKNQKRRVDFIDQWERRYALATEYEAETARLRELSGVAAIHKRIGQAETVSNELEETILSSAANTIEGVLAKVDFFGSMDRVVACFGHWKRSTHGNILAFGWSLSDDLRRLRAAGQLPPVLS